MSNTHQDYFAEAECRDDCCNPVAEPETMASRNTASYEEKTSEQPFVPPALWAELDEADAHADKVAERFEHEVQGSSCDVCKEDQDREASQLRQFLFDPGSAIITNAVEGTDDPFEVAVNKTFDDARVLLLSKFHDYGAKNISMSPGGPINGLRVRLHDKLARLNNLMDKGVDPKNESLRDTAIDGMNYFAIILMVLDGTWPTE